MAKKISEAVLAVLSAATILPETNGQSAVKLTGQLDRKLYVETNKVLEAAGGKWNRKAQAHLFPGDAAARLDDVILAGEITDARQEFGVFFTPPPIARLAAERAGLASGMVVLEPSAGRGALAGLARDAGCEVDCVELQDGFAADLEGQGYRRVVCGDFLVQAPGRGYDRVLMNPPFARQADIRHVEHALRFVRPGGRLVAIMAAGVEFRSDRRAAGFRDLVAERGGEITRLPPGAFAASGTGVSTVLVSIDAPLAA